MTARRYGGVYDGYIGEHSQRQTHMGEFRVVTTLNHMGKGERRESTCKYSIQEAKGTKEEQVTTIPGLYREEPLEEPLWEGQPSSWAEEFRGRGSGMPATPCNT